MCIKSISVSVEQKTAEQNYQILLDKLPKLARESKFVVDGACIAV